jgi:hypothetical protein
MYAGNLQISRLLPRHNEEFHLKKEYIFLEKEIKSGEI